MVLPIVGYHGGKRRLLPVIRPFLEPQLIQRYVEPFTGMGAVYLDLRARGYRGPALLADSNRCVGDLWRLLHDGGMSAQLIEAASSLQPTTDVRVYSDTLCKDEEDPIRRVALFLWLTNYAYAGVAPLYRGEGRGWVGSGCKLAGCQKWGRAFSWEKCVERLVAAARLLEGLPCMVYDSAQDVPVGPEDTVYADPPYLGTRGYGVKGKDNKEERDFSPLICGWPAQQILYSEARLLELEWYRISTEVVARASKRTDKGSIGKRVEYIYMKSEPEDFLSILEG